MKSMIHAAIAAGLAAVLFAGAAGAATVHKAVKYGAAPGYTTGGDFDTVIGPKAKIIRPGGKVSLNPQPLPPRTRR